MRRAQIRRDSAASGAKFSRRVVGAGVDVQLGRTPACMSRGEGDVLVAEQVDGADVDERRRQPGQVGRPGPGPRTGRPRRRPGTRPRPRCCRPGPRCRCRRSRGWTGSRCGRRASGRSASGSASAGPPRSRASRAVADGQAAARAAAVDGQPVGVDAELAGVPGRPDQAGVAVLDRRGVRVSRGPAGTRPNDDGADLVADRRRWRPRPRVAEDHAAAVDVVDARAASRARHRAVDAQRDVRLAVRPRVAAVLSGDLRIGREPQGRAQQLPQPWPGARRCPGSTLYPPGRAASMRIQRDSRTPGR